MSAEKMLDMRVRLTEAENPRLYAAIAGIRGQTSKWVRGGIIRRLLDHGLMFEEQRDLQLRLAAQAQAEPHHNPTPTGNAAPRGAASKASKSAAVKVAAKRAPAPRSVAPRTVKTSSPAKKGVRK